MRRSQRGKLEAGAFDQLFSEHFVPIHRYLRRRVGKQLADELAAETFTQAFASRRRYDERAGGPRPWLFGIAANLLRRHYRDEERLLRAYARSRPDSLSDDSDVVERVDAALAAPSVADALRVLRRAERDVLLLYAWADLTYDEIAEVLDLPLGTVRSRLHRARLHLQAALDGDGRAVAGEDHIVKGVG